MKSEIPHFDLATKCIACFLLGGSQQIGMESVTVQKYREGDHNKNNENREAARDPGDKLRPLSAPLRSGPPNRLRGRIIGKWRLW